MVHKIKFTQDSSLVQTLDVSGNTASDEILYYQIYCNTPNDPVITNNVPFNVSISKEGYKTLYINDISINEGQPTYLRCQLVEPDAPIYYQQSIDGSISYTNLSGSINPISLTGTINQTTLKGNISTLNLIGEVDI